MLDLACEIAPPCCLLFTYKLYLLFQINVSHRQGIGYHVRNPSLSNLEFAFVKNGVLYGLLISNYLTKFLVDIREHQ